MKYLVFLISLLILTSCSTERRIANKYLKNNKPGNVLLLAPDLVYKNSYKVPSEIKDFETLPQEVKDSITFFNSDLVQFVDDSAYSEVFMKSLERGLDYFGYDVFQDELDEEFFNTQNEPSLIINLVQVQLEEFLEVVKDEAYFEPDSADMIAVYITAVNLNNWVELTRLNQTDEKPELLFNSQTIYDDFNGNFRYFPMSGELDYYYTIDSLEVSHIYQAADRLGFRYAQWLFDYILNDYVGRNMPEGIKREKFFSYDFQNKALKRLRYQPFEKVKE